jgi:hypothetical protein
MKMMARTLRAASINSPFSRLPRLSNNITVPAGILAPRFIGYFTPKVSTELLITKRVRNRLATATPHVNHVAIL